MPVAKVMASRFGGGGEPEEDMDGVLHLDASDPRVDFLEPGNRRRARDAAYRNSSKNTVKIVFESFFSVCSLLKSLMGCLNTCL